MLGDQVIKQDGFLVLNCPYAEFYIPKSYTDNGLASDDGESFRSFGVFYLRTFSAIDRPNNLEIMELPSFINLFPHEKESRKMTIGNDTEDDYIVLKFFKGEKIMAEGIKCEGSGAELFLNTLLGGRIPSNIPYNKVLNLFLKSIDMNQIKLNVPIFIYEMIISEVYRYKENSALRYGQVAGKNFSEKDKLLNYIKANVRTICKANSSFAGVTFENFDEMLTSAINNNKYNRKETKTPVEDIIKY